jgi:hypothetical protein
MGGPNTAANAATSIDIPGQGKLSVAPDAKAPLLVVFGGIDVHRVHSGVYMWNYMSNIKDRFHIFVALSNHVNGTLAYRSLMKTLQTKSLTPSKQILYLFSGGYKPGIDVLNSGGPNLFSSIYLVDIWMGSDSVAKYYEDLADTYTAKITYVYTSGAAQNNAARDHIAKKVGARATLFKGDHMGTNTVAVRTLP